MSTEIAAENDLSDRVARFDDLNALAVQKAGIPLEVMDLIYSRELKPVVTIGEDPSSPFGSIAPIVGAAGISITYATCPPGTGPTLHAHRATYETFTVMEGKFSFFWGENAENSVTLEKFDVISVPPAIYRGFKNVGEVEGTLQVVISGGVHDSRDIFFPRHTADLIAQKGQEYLDFFVHEAGLHFN